MNENESKAQGFAAPIHFRAVKSTLGGFRLVAGENDMRAPTRFLIRRWSLHYTPIYPLLSIYPAVDTDLVSRLRRSFDDRSLIRSPTDTCIKLPVCASASHRLNGRCRARAHAPPSLPAVERCYFWRHFGTRLTFRLRKRTIKRLYLI